MEAQGNQLQVWLGDCASPIRNHKSEIVDRASFSRQPEGGIAFLSGVYNPATPRSFAAF
jgi:hypothetical protein